MTKATPNQEYTLEAVRLHLALELSAQKWVLALAPSLADKPLRRSIAAGDRQALAQALEAARKRFGLVPETPVVSCYEAGRDAFWVHRWLDRQGIENVVIDSSSIEVNRRSRRAKSDRLDAAALLRLLIRFYQGDRAAFSSVRVPTPEQEDARHLHRHLKMLKRSRTRAVNRLRGLLATQGVRLKKIRPGLHQRMERLRDWQGRRLRPGLVQRAAGASLQLDWLDEQISAIDQQRRELLRESEEENLRGVRHLMGLKAVGVHTAWILEHEVFAWRDIRNRRQLGGLIGVAPTPYQSGGSNREQGISKAGNRWVRSVAVEMAWMWVRYPPDSELTRWFERRFASGGVRARKVGIVALTRRLLIQLWHFRCYGVIPPGAVLKPKLRF